MNREPYTRKLILYVVMEVLEEKKHSNTVLHEVFNQHSPSSIEKSMIKRESYGVIERAIELDAIINRFSKTKVDKMKPVIRNILRMGAYEICYMQFIPESATCNEMVKLVEKHGLTGLKGFVNAILRTICREKDNLEWKDTSILYSMPEWIVALLEKSYGKKTTKKILNSFLDVKEITIRVNTEKRTMEQCRDTMLDHGITVSEGHYVKDAIIIRDMDRIEKLPGYYEGHFIVQDESSMLPVLCSGIKEGDNVIDICAAPGGKTMQAAEYLHGTGTVWARDISEYKIRKIEENKRRLKLNNIVCSVMDGAIYHKESEQSADVVIADVPCSGIGIIGKKPDIKYQITEQSVEELIVLQRKILENAVRYVKPGGVLMFSTCTLNPAENIQQARWLEEQYPIKLESLDDWLPKKLQSNMTKSGMLQVLPGIHKSDGFFLARFRKEVGDT